jgi:hypothetical protein
MDYDNKVKLRCKNCGGIFEFLPGFGSFSLPEHEQRSSVRHEGSMPRYRHEVYEADAPWGTERPPGQQGSCGVCCTIIFCLCFIVPVIIAFMSIILGFGFFWFW